MVSCPVGADTDQGWTDQLFPIIIIMVKSPEVRPVVSQSGKPPRIKTTHWQGQSSGSLNSEVVWVLCPEQYNII